MDRDYKVILAATGLNTVVTAMLYASLQFMALEISGSLFYVGLVSSLPYLGLFVMAYVWGLLSDYLGKRKNIVIVSGMIGSVLFLLYPFLTSIEELIILRLIQVCLMGSVILLIAVVTEKFPTEKGKVIGDLNVPLAAGWVIGAGLAAILFQTPAMASKGVQLSLFPNVSPEVLQWIFFITCTIIGLAASVVLIPLHELKKDSSTSLGPFREMLNFNNKREIGILCTATALLLTGNYIIYSVFATYLQIPAFNLAPWQIGLIVAGSGLFGMFVFRFAGRLVDRKGRKAVLLPTIAVYAISWTIYASTANIYIITILWILPYWSFFTTSSTAMVSDLTDERERGRGVGILNAAINFGNFAGSLLGGLLAMRFIVAFGTKETKPEKLSVEKAPVK
jgi:MFS family permease